MVRPDEPVPPSSPTRSAAWTARPHDGRTFAKVDPGHRHAAVPRGAVERRRRRAGGGRGQAGAAGLGRADGGQARRHPARDRHPDARAPRRRSPSWWRARPASRRRTRSARPTPRSRWASSSPARAAASTARPPRARCRTRRRMVVRQPLGVAGLIIAANTPIANVAWKAFPALLCGNAAVLKAAEDTPLSAWAFGVLAREAGVPDGVYSTIHGFGEQAGRAARRASRRRRRQLHRLVRGGALDCRRRPGRGWPRPASSSAARTRSSSATTPTCRTR